MGWPWLRFEKFYAAYLRRKVIEELAARKIAMSAALYANTNYDSEENRNKREQVLERMEEQFNEICRRLYNYKEIQEEERKFKEDPFFKAMERGFERQGLGNGGS